MDRVLHVVNRFLVHRADRIVALGETMRQGLINGKGASPGKTIVIPDWADCHVIRPGSKINPFSRAHGLDDKFVVMHSGNIGLSQGLENLVEAAAYLKDIREIQILFVGDGVKKSHLEGMAQNLGLNNVRFLPYQPKESLQHSFASADMFVVSLKRGLAGYIVPSKLYGILAAGRPYVAAVEEPCEVAEITRSYECGLLAEPEDAKDIADKIVTLYHDRTLARRLGTNARRAALNFDRSTQVKQYYGLFCDLVPPASPRPKRRSSLLKRPFDAILAGVGLVLSIPLWALIAAAIKLDDGGRVFYGQDRVGKGGRRFKSWKFRTMLSLSDERFGPLQARDGDPRVTRVGRVLRATAVDELPQLWNILKGDMSFVGPRALVPREIEVNGNGESIPLDEIDGYELRHSVRPGLTGLAQVYASKDLTRRQKFKYDLLYVRRHNFLLDLKLIALSFWISFRGRWEYRNRKF